MSLCLQTINREMSIKKNAVYAVTVLLCLMFRCRQLCLMRKFIHCGGIAVAVEKNCRFCGCMPMAFSVVFHSYRAFEPPCSCCSQYWLLLPDITPTPAAAPDNFEEEQYIFTNSPPTGHWRKSFNSDHLLFRPPVTWRNLVLNIFSPSKAWQQ